MGVRRPKAPDCVVRRTWFGGWDGCGVSVGASVSITLTSGDGVGALVREGRRVMLIGK